MVFVRSIGQLLINIETHKFHKSEIISWRRQVANFVHVNKHMWELCGNIILCPPHTNTQIDKQTDTETKKKIFGIWFRMC